MENKELLRENIAHTIDSINLSNGVAVIFGEEEININCEHQQDCCENVYADFDDFKYHVDEITGKEVKEIIFKGVDGIGFLICFYFDYDVSEKVFIPCHNSQNGYYSSNLSLVVTRNKVVKKIDISDLVEDNIN